MAYAPRDLLHGAIDLHIHVAPDILPRLMDDLELAEAARDAGMAAVVMKSHHMLTADRAQIAQKLTPGIRVFGGLALNRPACGGLNPDAVRVAIAMGARIIWLPTFSSVNHIKRTAAGATGNLGLMAQGFSRTPVEVVNERGEAVPELLEILGLIAQADIILATGHISALETKAVVDAALKAGVQKILVNHAELWLIDMSIQDQRELAAKGVMLERCIRSVTAEKTGHPTPALIAEQIKAVGAASSVMATDYGQVDSPPPPEGMQWYIEQMLRNGIEDEEIVTMVRTNPGRLLGI